MIPPERRRTAMRPRRYGFTLIELLIVMVIVAILATIGMNRFWSVKDRAYINSLKHDMRVLAVQQETYFSKNFTYASNVTDIADYVVSPGVSIIVTAVQQDGWAATASHVSLGLKQCGLFTGNVAPTMAPPATSSGVVDSN
jgi:prepilin-type N-terminal cleavage/methylation domain-containing protein